MIQVIIAVYKQVSPDDWSKKHYTKTFYETSTLQDIKDWLKEHDATLLDVSFGTND